VVSGFASDFLRQTELSRQCVKLVGKRHAFTIQHGLAFANHMHQFDAELSEFLCKRGHEIMPKGMFHDRRNDYQKA
jgi:hypothetical protein